MDDLDAEVPSGTLWGLLGFGFGRFWPCLAAGRPQHNNHLRPKLQGRVGAREATGSWDLQAGLVVQSGSKVDFLLFYF